jgi:hypothetical protein
MCLASFSAFGRLYRRLLREYSHLGGNISHSVLSYSVQLFTIPTMTPLVVRNHGLLHHVVGALHDAVTANLNRTGVVDFAGHKLPRSSYDQIAHDIGYILANEGVAEWAWGDIPVASPMSPILTWLKVLSYAHFSDRQLRSVMAHVDFVSTTWQQALMFALNLAPLTENFVKGLSAALATDPSKADIAIRVCETALKEIEDSELGMRPQVGSESGGGPRVTKWVHVITSPIWSASSSSTSAIHVPAQVTYCNVDLDKRAVSAHFPLHRAIAQLLGAVARATLSSPHTWPLVQVVADGTPDKIVSWWLQFLHAPLSMEALMAQAAAGFWVRNGDSMLDVRHNYYSACRGAMRDGDLLALQLGSCAVPRDQFVLLSLFQFGLHRFWDSTAPSPQHGSQAVAIIEMGRPPFQADPRQTILVAEAWFNMMVTICSDRLQMEYTRERLRLMVIHFLMGQPLPFSTLVRANMLTLTCFCLG